jgi:hypothetical protein
MNLPRFTAEASLYNSATPYLSSCVNHAEMGLNVTPQLRSQFFSCVCGSGSLGDFCLCDDDGGAESLRSAYYGIPDDLTPGISTLPNSFGGGGREGGDTFGGGGGSGAGGASDNTHSPDSGEIECRRNCYNRFRTNADRLRTCLEDC